jgi:hypothetical protein
MTTLAEHPSAAPPADPGTDDRGRAYRAWIGVLRGDPNAAAALTEGQWGAFVDAAMRNGLVAATYRALEADSIAPLVPAAVRAELRGYFVERSLRNALLLRQTGEIVRALRADGIEVMLLKGIHLARFVYPEPAWRSMADVDLMVPRADLRRAEAILVATGFGPAPRPDLEAFCRWSNHLAKLVKAGAPVVELHYAIERPTSPLRIDHEGLWNRSRTVEFEGSRVRVLSTEDLLLHLAVHGSYHHRFDRSAIKCLVDVREVIERAGPVDWAELASRANAWGAGPFGYATLGLARTVLGANVPERVLRDLDHQGVDDQVVAIASRYILAPPEDVPVVYRALVGTASTRGRASLLLRSVFPPRDQLEASYGGNPGTPLGYLYLRRLADLAQRRSKWLVGWLLRGGSARRSRDHEMDRGRLEQWARARSGTEPPEPRAESS